MVKIFPTMFMVENKDVTADQLWVWVNNKIKESKVKQIVPVTVEYNASKASYKGLVEVHCDENITTKELSDILTPYPSFIRHIYFTYQ